MLYFFGARSVQVAGRRIDAHAAIELRADAQVELVNGEDEAAEFLLLQGRPIGEPVAQYGPFVMNTQAEIAAGHGRLPRAPSSAAGPGPTRRRCTGATRRALRGIRTDKKSGRAILLSNSACKMNSPTA